MKIINENEEYEHHFKENDIFIKHKFSVDLRTGEVIFDVKLDRKTKEKIYEKGYLI